MADEVEILDNTDTEEKKIVERDLFDTMGLLVMFVRMSLEGNSEGSPLPRYQRILRINSVVVENDDSFVNKVAKDFIKPTVSIISEGLIRAVNSLIDLTIDAKDLITATDSLVAEGEVMLNLIKRVAEEQILQSLALAVDPHGDLYDAGRFKMPPEVAENLSKAEDFLANFPTPDDLDFLGHELYRLACIIHKAVDVPDIDAMGKVRILQFGFKKNWDSYTDSTDKNEDLTEDLGKRSLLKLAPKTGPDFTNLTTDNVSNNGILLYEIGDDFAAKDQEDAIKLLGLLGYNSGLYKKRIQEFQYINKIPVSGVFDDATVNRLFNLDIEKQNLKRALKRNSSVDNVGFDKITFGYIPLHNHNADDIINETVIATQGYNYDYYVIKTINQADENRVDIPANRGNWRAVIGDNYIRGFVAIESRKIISNNPGEIYDGKSASEGAAYNGRFFFSARHTEPWRAGRYGKPGDSEIYKDGVTTNSKKISRMIQTVPIPGDALQLEDPVTATIEGKDITTSQHVIFTALAQARSLYNDKTGGIPDQTRILLEILDEEGNVILKDNRPAKETWFPSGTISTDVVKSRAVDYQNLWYTQSSEKLSLTHTMVSDQGEKPMFVKVILEGLHNSNYDCDAYFDEVRLKWEQISIETPTPADPTS